MEITSLSSAPVSIVAAKSSGNAQVSMLRKAIDMQSAVADTLIQSVSETPTLPANPNIGRIINTIA